MTTTSRVLGDWAPVTLGTRARTVADWATAASSAGSRPRCRHRPIRRAAPPPALDVAALRQRPRGPHD